MTTRQFDPVFSAALRNELEALADRQQEAPRPARRPLRELLHRPQLWVSVITAVVLAVATIGVLRATHATEPAAPPASIDPLAQITDPSSADYVAREVQVLRASRGTGTGQSSFDVPGSVTSIRVYVDCAPAGHFSVSIDGNGAFSGGCDRGIATSFDMPITSGSHTVSATVAKGTRFSVLVIASPAPAIATGAIIDPLAQIRDLRNPDALVGGTTPLLQTGGTGDGGGGTSFTPTGVLRAWFVCDRSLPAATAVIAGHRLVGCMNSIAHWTDLTARSSQLTAAVSGTGSAAWKVLVVRAPAGAKPSPSAATLPYPSVSGPRLGAARGSGAPVSGTYRQTTSFALVTTTCRGTGWLDVQLGDGSATNTRGQNCATSAPASVGMGGAKPSKRALQWTVIPHGDITWTFQLTADAQTASASAG